jgi:hypothetical protein
MAFYPGAKWNNADRVMPDSGKRKVNIEIYGTQRFDHETSQEEKADALVSALREHEDKLRTWKSIRHARSDILTDIEFDTFEAFVGTKYAERGSAPSAEEVREFGRALNVVDPNPPIDPRLPRFDRVRDSLGKAVPF